MTVRSEVYITSESMTNVLEVEIKASAICTANRCIFLWWIESYNTSDSKRYIYQF